MEKISLYEILSYLGSGFFILFFTDAYWFYVMYHHPFLQQNDLEKSIFFILTALFLGVIFHSVTFSIIKTRLIKKYIYPSVDSYVDKDADLKEIKKVIRDNIAEKTSLVKDYFDVAYYHLEVNDKIITAKNFQSIYFWLRNVFCFLLLSIPIQILLLAFSFFHLYRFNTCIAFYFLIFSIVILLLLIKPIQFYRGKMIHRILWSYYNILHNKIT